MLTITVEELIRLTALALRKSGASQPMALAAAKALVAADMEGLPTHGVSRTSLYAQHLREGRADGKAKPRIAKRSGATCLVDACGGLAFQASAIAVTEAVKRARRHGIAMSGVMNSHHFGAAAYHLTPVADAGFVGIAFSNAPSAINAWGGKKPLFGTNPIAAIFPRRNKSPIIVDLSLTEVVRGKIMLYAKEGKPIPVGWALDSEGKPTTDARVALAGSLAAVGGMKGTMLALIVEVVCCALTGAAFSFESDSYFAPGGKPRIGHSFIVINPDGLAGTEYYYSRLEVMIARMLAEEGVRLPGSRRHAAVTKARATGIEISESLHEELIQLSA